MGVGDSRQAGPASADGPPPVTSEYVIEVLDAPELRLRVHNLISLFHRRWNAPLLAELHRTDGAKFVTLAHRLQASPTIVRQTLDELIELGWVQPNPGYGHPLRPEYILTREGARVAPNCVHLCEALAAVEAVSLGLKKWSMPVLYVVGHGARRFAEVAEHLADSTDRAVAIGLKDLGSASLVGREVENSFPPSAIYLPTANGKRLMPILDGLGRALV